MESILPWELFSHGVTAEETDEILPDDMLDEQRTLVKQEPEELLPDDSGAYHTERNFRRNAPKASTVTNAIDNDDEDDDNTIFQFDFDSSQTPIHQQQKQSQPQQKQREQQQTPTFNEQKRGSAKFSDTDAHINFEAAVIYICPACGAEFDTQDSWKRHLNGVHSYNTLRGLNFVKVNQLYHECLQCDRHIAKHAMENLLKHKFTHLPYRCTKCRFCFREYKYRQDLIIHLRITHRDDVVALTQTMPVPNTPNATMTASKTMKPYPNNNSNKEKSKPGLEIMEIKENAFDIFENTCDDIPVKNELIEPDESDIELITDHMQDSYAGSSFVDDAQSGSSSRVTDWHETKLESNLLDKYVQFICPQCGIEYESERNWKDHVEKLHKFDSCEGLNFGKLNENGCAQCLECKKTIYMHSIRNLQLHKFSHSPYKSWLRCNLCQRSYVGQREIVRHLMAQHNIDANGNVNGTQVISSNATSHEMITDDNGDVDEESQDITGMDANDNDIDNNTSANENYQMKSTAKPERGERDRDMYEKHIEYLCPQCGKEFRDKKLWRAHTVRVHFLTNLKVLNFKKVSRTELMCIECMKLITNAYGIQNALQHAITHMPYKAYARCRICSQAYTERKGLVKHLRKRHNIGEGNGDVMIGGGGGDNGNNSSPNKSLQYGRVMSVLPPLPTSTSMKRRQPVKEIVRHADVTFEIQYLDDDEGDDNNAVPELSYDASNYGSSLPWSRHKCVDCGSIFSTQQALQTHVQEEHEFLDYDKANNAKKQQLEVIPTPNHEDDDYSNSSNSNPAQMNKYNAPSFKLPERHFIYLCPACGKEFRIQGLWRRHINEVHHFDNRHVLNFQPVQKFRYQCNECHAVISNTKLKCLQEHKFRHLPHRLYLKCRYCGMCYNHKPNLRTHLRVRHNIVEIEHLETAIENNMNASTTTTTTTTATTNTSNNPCSSSMSSLSASNPQVISTVGDCISYHNAVDHPSVTYFCPECNQPFDTHVFWRKHIVEVHGLNSIPGLNFRKLDNHHYLCLQCYKRVTVTHTKGAIGQLQSHKFRHLPYRAFKCTECNGEFVRKQMFFKHLNRRTNSCEQDSRIVAPSESATEHGPTSCTSCGYCLNCPQCGQSFDSWWQWRNHINEVHGLNKRETLRFRWLRPELHECMDCGQRVSSSSFFVLQTHRFKHLPHSKYLQCNLCTASFILFSDIKQHLKDKHPEFDLGQMDENERQLAEEQLGEETNDESMAEVKPDLSTIERNENDEKGRVTGSTNGGEMQDLIEQVPQLESVENELNAMNRYASLADDAPFLLD